MLLSINVIWLFVSLVDFYQFQLLPLCCQNRMSQTWSWSQIWRRTNTKCYEEKLETCVGRSWSPTRTWDTSPVDQSQLGTRSRDPSWPITAPCPHLLSHPRPTDPSPGHGESSREQFCVWTRDVNEPTSTFTIKNLSNWEIKLRKWT